VSRLWTKEEENKFIELYPTIPTEDLIIMFGRAKQALVTKAYKLGVKKIIRSDGLRYIYKDEEEKIIEYSKIHSIPEIQRKFNRDYKTIFRLLKGNNCNILSSSRWWTKEQENFLIDNFYTKTPEVIVKTLNKKWRTITKKAREMGMKRLTNKGVPRRLPIPLTNEEKRFIIENYDKVPSAIISKTINRKNDIVINFCEQNGLQIIKSRKNLEDYSNGFLLDALKRKFSDFNRCPTSEEIQKDCRLPSIDIYYDRFGSFSNACYLAGLEPNIGIYGTPCYSKNGDKCYSVAEQIITNYFIDNNIKYEKECEYYKIIPNVRCGIVMDWYISHTIVEYFGMQKFENYRLKTKMKQKICKENNMKIISIFPEDMKDLDKIFHDYK
jgi:hypothetical protein